MSNISNAHDCGIVCLPDSPDRASLLMCAAVSVVSSKACAGWYARIKEAGHCHERMRTMNQMLSLVTAFHTWPLYCRACALVPRSGAQLQRSIPGSLSSACHMACEEGRSCMRSAHNADLAYARTCHWLPGRPIGCCRPDIALTVARGIYQLKQCACVHHYNSSGTSRPAHRGSSQCPRQGRRMIQWPLPARTSQHPLWQRVTSSQCPLCLAAMAIQKTNV